MSDYNFHPHLDKVLHDLNERLDTVKEYTVTWEIELDAHSPEEAARKALEIQRDSTSTATFFNVDGELINASDRT